MGWFKRIFRGFDWREMALKSAFKALDEGAEKALEEIDDLPDAEVSPEERGFMKRGVDLIVARAKEELTKRLPA